METIQASVQKRLFVVSRFKMTLYYLVYLYSEK